MVNKIANQVKCELRDAVRDVIAEYDNPDIKWLSDWSAKVTLKIVVDEKSSLNPGLSFNTLFPSAVNKFGNGTTVTTPQSFSFGIGGQFSSDATRTETIGFFFVFKELLTKTGLCPIGQGPLIESDLKLHDWLEAAALTAETPGTISDPFVSGAPFDVISHEVSFVIVAGGNVTPTWKLVYLSANPTAPFLGVTRTRTDDVLITMGPIGELKNGRPVGPSLAVENAHLAAQIGQSVAAAIQSQQH